MGYGIRYSHILFLVPGLQVKNVPRKIATSKYFGNRFLIIGALGIPFSVLHLLVPDTNIGLAIMGFYFIIVVGFFIFIGATVSRLNEYNSKIMLNYRKQKREKEKAKVKPRPVGRNSSDTNKAEEDNSSPEPKPE
jgi:hypothetical protein